MLDHYNQDTCNKIINRYKIILGMYVKNDKFIEYSDYYIADLFHDNVETNFDHEKMVEIIILLRNLFLNFYVKFECFDYTKYFHQVHIRNHTLEISIPTNVKFQIINHFSISSPNRNRTMLYLSTFILSYYAFLKGTEDKNMNLHMMTNFINNPISKLMLSPSIGMYFEEQNNSLTPRYEDEDFLMVETFFDFEYDDEPA